MASTQVPTRPDENPPSSEGDVPASTPPAAKGHRTWIVSPGWDLAYLVLTPLLIVPAVLLASEHWLQPEQIYLAVISFASLGHHLPGFMRAYGDHDLFVRFRWRFLLAPPLALGLALVFTPPTPLKQALSLPWTHLHGLELILLVWGTWHGLMQTYGFMRIYDLRRGANDPHAGRLDHALCLAIFTAGVVLSDTRMFGVAGAMWQAGLPLFGPEWLTGVRWVVGGAGAIVAATYAAHLLARWRRGQQVNYVKLLLAGVTGWFYWYCGRLSTNLLIGVAMFEIYHAVQYNAIVWIYNRRLFERAGERFGPLGFMFRDRLTMLGVYLAAIGAYSSIRFFTAHAGDRIFSGELHEAHQWLIALFVASSLLHFYYDGFIWKVSQPKTRENLVDEALAVSTGERLVPGFVHAGKWALLLAIAAALALSERSYRDPDVAARQAAERAALARLTPNVPESQMLGSQLALAAGNAPQAAELARKAAAQRPASHEAQAELAWALMAMGDDAAALPPLERAIALQPDRWDYRCDLGEVYEALDEPDRAIQEFRTAVKLAPQEVEPRQRLANLLLRQDDAASAVELLATPSRAKPRDAKLKLAYGAALAAAGRYGEAVDVLQKAIKLDPQSAEAFYQMGLLRLQQGKPQDAVEPLHEATRLDPKHFQAQLQLGDALIALGEPSVAAGVYRRAVALRPDLADARVCLADALLKAGDAVEAEQTLRDGLADKPDSPELNFTLGLLLRQLGSSAEANRLLDRAADLGLSADSGPQQP
jgi:tetratricopeptide (TPR) repeat protein